MSIRLLRHAWRKTLGLPLMVRRAVMAAAVEHDGMNLAQSAAYSAIIALFPALIVSAAVIALLPDVAPLKLQVGEFFDQVLPAEVFPLLTSYFAGSPGSPHTARALIAATLVSITGASSIIATLMEGVRRAENLPQDGWTFWQRRRRALLLVPLSIVPFAIATVLVIFGRLIAGWLGNDLAPSIQPAFFATVLVLRWTVALAGVAGISASIYHMGVPRRQSWLRSLPGAIMATILWFVSTLAFGWYVTRLANYSQVYGSLGAGIALLVWLYLVFLSLLCGAEFNVQWAGDTAPSTHPAPVPVIPRASSSATSLDAPPPLGVRNG